MVLSGEDSVERLLETAGLTDEAPDPLDIVREGLIPRLSSEHSRPTDLSWVISRLVSMKGETWERLQQIAEEVSAEKRKVSAGQVAAFLIEHSLEEYK